MGDASQRGRLACIVGARPNYMKMAPLIRAFADTPGLREIGMWGLDPAHLDSCFPEFRPLTSQCRFADCTHTVEPECAVLEAIAAGDVSAGRHESYVKLRDELQEAARSW